MSVFKKCCNRRKMAPQQLEEHKVLSGNSTKAVRGPQIGTDKEKDKEVLRPEGIKSFRGCCKAFLQETTEIIRLRPGVRVQWSYSTDRGVIIRESAEGKFKLHINRTGMFALYYQGLESCTETYGFSSGSKISAWREHNLS